MNCGVSWCTEIAFNQGWARIGLLLYRPKYPILTTSSPQCLIQDLPSQGENTGSNPVGTRNFPPGEFPRFTIYDLRPLWEILVNGKS